MAPRALGRTPVGMALIAWRVWQRLPPPAKRRAFRLARKHGLRLATTHGPRVATLLLAKRASSKRR
jgi:hypothetical protein